MALYMLALAIVFAIGLAIGWFWGSIEAERNITKAIARMKGHNDAQ